MLRYFRLLRAPGLSLLKGFRLAAFVTHTQGSRESMTHPGSQRATGNFILSRRQGHLAPVLLFSLQFQVLVKILAFGNSQFNAAGFSSRKLKAQESQRPLKWSRVT